MAQASLTTPIRLVDGLPGTIGGDSTMHRLLGHQEAVEGVLVNRWEQSHCDCADAIDFARRTRVRNSAR